MARKNLQEKSSANLKISDREYRTIWEYLTWKDVPDSAIRDLLNHEDIGITEENFPEYYKKLERTIISLGEQNPDIWTYINRFEMVSNLRESSHLILNLEKTVQEGKGKLKPFFDETMNLLYNAVMDYDFEINRKAVPAIEGKNNLCVHKNVLGFVLIKLEESGYHSIDFSFLKRYKRKGFFREVNVPSKSGSAGFIELNTFNYFESQENTYREYGVFIKEPFSNKNEKRHLPYTTKEFIDKIMVKAKPNAEMLEKFIKVLIYSRQQAERYLVKKQENLQKAIKEINK